MWYQYPKGCLEVATRLLGREIQKATKETEDFWTRLCPDVRTKNTLILSGAMSLEDVQILGYYYFERFPNCGKHTLVNIGKLIGGWPGDQHEYDSDPRFHALKTALKNKKEPTSNWVSYLLHVIDTADKEAGFIRAHEDSLYFAPYEERD